MAIWRYNVGENALGYPALKTAPTDPNRLNKCTSKHLRIHVGHKFHIFLQPPHARNPNWCWPAIIGGQAKRLFTVKPRLLTGIAGLVHFPPRSCIIITTTMELVGMSCHIMNTEVWRTGKIRAGFNREFYVYWVNVFTWFTLINVINFVQPISSVVITFRCNRIKFVFRLIHVQYWNYFRTITTVAWIFYLYFNHIFPFPSAGRLL